jgi:hypothetical protein
MSEPKETHYFDLNYERGPAWYAGLFPEPVDGRALGESTPEYLFLPWARDRMCRDLPDAKFIVSLRDPVERAWSHYSMLRARGREELSFEEALDRETERLRDRGSWSRYGYASKGLYAKQLGELYAEVGRERVLVLMFEREVLEEPVETFRRLCGFLGLEVWTPPEVGDVVNAALRIRSTRLRDASLRLPKRLRDAVGRINNAPAETDVMPEQARERLLEHFRIPNQQLESLLGRELPEWAGSTQAD